MRLEYFQLIDRVADLNLTELTIRVEANVPQTSTIFEGHFPGRPLMPGVLLVETMAQTSGWLVIAHTRFEKMPFLVAIKEAKLRTFVTPGQSLIATARIAHEGSGFTVTEAQITADGKPVCSATITLRIMPFPNDEFRTSMEAMAAKVGLPVKVATHD